MRPARRAATPLDLAAVQALAIQALAVQAPAEAPRAVSYPPVYCVRMYADVVAEFAHGKVDPHEAGKKGGQTSS
jgi:hypothetical protein